ncbi:hypothetical protein [Acinetobacter sp. YH12054]|uniref:hypothetical protein n=1 Tax=Acinetobacter sp. YH12054 TaxID=2601056 RepID=UPI00211E8C72|nr:hypothetical protein [Acinetobacter sp. YH12054]
MFDKTTTDLNTLDDEILSLFLYFYEYTFEEEDEPSSHFDSRRKILMACMEQNEFKVSQRIKNQQEFFGDIVSVPFEPVQIFELLKQIDSLKHEADNLPPRLYKKRYSEILLAYVEIIGTLDLIQNKEIARKAKATLAVQARYKKHLYPRREILYRVLRDHLALRGCKWDNLNQAITSILPTLKKEYDEYNIEWVRSQIDLKRGLLQKLKQAESSSRKIKKLQTELYELEKILESKYPSKMLEKSNFKIPYNTDYVDETIIHELRNHPEILKEILLGNR